ncbi:carbohydrate-binding domain-containing protein [Glaciecola siphonariae]|uniref:Carbohydrate-binding domain-containing protein n=1 Tax=Glaciecola siphonariae TaxID=521012 RepID=A0ABV9M0J2_9ALTE
MERTSRLTRLLNISITRFQVSFVIIACAISVHSIAGENFEERALELIERASQFNTNNKKHAFHVASAKFKMYAITKEDAYLSEALLDVSDGLSDIRNDTDHKDIAFALWSAMDVYLRWNTYLPTEIKDDFRITLTTTPSWGIHNTSNKNAMASSARYLAALEWPNEEFASAYKFDDIDGSAQILNTLETMAEYGDYEYNSSTYTLFHYGALRTLADFAPVEDPNSIKQKSFVAAEWILASSAAEWMDGHWVASQDRSTLLPSHSQNTYVHMDYVHYMFYGGVKPKAINHPDLIVGAVMHAISPYRPPAELVSIASQRNQSYVSRERKSSIDEGGRHEKYAQLYKTPEYAVYSEAVEFRPPVPASAKKWKNQNEQWGIAWRGGSKRSILTIKNPFLYENVATSNPDWGVSQFGQVMQDAGTVIGVYNIPTGYEARFLKGYIPDNYLAFIDNSNSGKVYLHYDGVLIGIMLTKGFSWNNGMTSFERRAGKIGFVVETASPDDYQGTPAQKLAAFKQAVLPRFDATEFSTSGQTYLGYVNLHGNKMEAKFNTYQRLNGVDVDFNSWPQVENPFVYQGAGSREMTVRFEDKTRHYDLSQWSLFGGGVSDDNGTVTIEATDYDKIETRYYAGTNSWFIGDELDGYSSTGYVFFPENSIKANYETSPQISYSFDLNESGTYAIWVRRFAPDGAGNSAHFALNGVRLKSADNRPENYNEWHWVRIGQVKMVEGEQILSVRKREDGYAIDQFLVSNDLGRNPNDSDVHTLGIRARGDTGNEIVSLVVDDTVVKQWQLSKQMQTYTVDTELQASSIVKVVFINDVYDFAKGIDYNVQLDYLKVNNTLMQTESQAYNDAAFNISTWTCGGGAASEYMHCAGEIIFDLSNIVF